VSAERGEAAAQLPHQPVDAQGPGHAAEVAGRQDPEPSGRQTPRLQRNVVRILIGAADFRWSLHQYASCCPNEH
jgi:hypothetical protein